MMLEFPATFFLSSTLVSRMELVTRTLSAQESRVVLTLSERRQRETTRKEIVDLLAATPKAADHVIESLRQKGWLERACWGVYFLVPADRGPYASVRSNPLALASRITDPYYIGYATAAAHYRLTADSLRTIFLVTPTRLRARRIGTDQLRIVNPSPAKFFGFEPVEIQGHKVLLSDREKTVIDCIDHPDLAGGFAASANILLRAAQRLDWSKTLGYLERMDSIALLQRFGWMADRLQAGLPPQLSLRLQQRIAQCRKTWLGPNPAISRVVPSAIGYDEKWRLFVNLTYQELPSGSSNPSGRTALRIRGKTHPAKRTETGSQAPNLNSNLHINVDLTKRKEAL